MLVSKNVRIFFVESWELTFQFLQKNIMPLVGVSPTRSQEKTRKIAKFTIIATAGWYLEDQATNLFFYDHIYNQFNRIYLIYDYMG